MANLSRTYIQELIKNKYVQINGLPALKASALIKEGDNLCVNIPLKKPRNLNLNDEILNAMGIESYVLPSDFTRGGATFMPYTSHELSLWQFFALSWVTYL